MSTPNLGLALPAHDAATWDVPNNGNFTTIDTVVGGGTLGNVLTSNGPNTAPTYQAVTSPPGTGTVTSVSMTVPGEFSVAGSPVTTAGTLAVTKATQSANLVWAGPTTGAAAQPTFRALVTADMPFAVGDFTVNPAWLGCGEGSNYPAVTTAGGQLGTGTANEVKCWMVRLFVTYKVLKLATRINTPLASSVSSFAMYNIAGTTKLFAWEGFNTAAGGSLNTTLGGAVTLTPGIYWSVCSCSQTGSAPATLGGYAATGTNEGVEPWNTNGTVRSGVAANAMAAGVLPATLGVISAGGGGFAALPLIIMEP